VPNLGGYAVAASEYMPIRPLVLLTFMVEKQYLETVTSVMAKTDVGQQVQKKIRVPEASKWKDNSIS